MFIYIKAVKCPGCGKHQEFSGRGLGMSVTREKNFKLLLSCCANCAQKFTGQKDNFNFGPDEIDYSFDLDSNDGGSCSIEKQPIKEYLMTPNGPLEYRAITKTLPAK